MRQLFTRPSPSLRRRVALAAAQEGIDPARYTRRVLERWLLSDPPRPLAPVNEETGPYQCWRCWVSDAAHQQARVQSAAMDVSISTLVIRIIEARVPQEVETMTRVLTEPPGGSR